MQDGSGFLYVLTNVAMPGLVKIGCTTGLVEDRMRDLSSSTSIPLPFECHFAAKVENMAAKEKTPHQLSRLGIAYRDENGIPFGYDGKEIDMNEAVKNAR